MPLEDSIYQRLIRSVALAAVLTQWDNTPAVFREAAPPDTNPSWAKDAQGNPVQYPRLVYLLDLQTNAGGVPTGLLHITVSARDIAAQPQVDEVLGPLRDTLDGSALYSPDLGLAVFQEIGRSVVPSVAE